MILMNDVLKSTSEVQQIQEFQPFVGITRLSLQNFRSYAEYTLNIHAKHVVVTGANGVGKTNLLEAISLFAPGRGMRGATPQEWTHSVLDQQNPTSLSWGVSITTHDDIRLTSKSPNRRSPTRRHILQEQTPLASQAAIVEYLSVVWLTPQMDGLFIDDSSARRRFFDRLIHAAHPEHAHHVLRYENALRHRNKLLKERAAPELIRSWNPILIAEAVAIAAARLEKTASLNMIFDTLELPFILPHLSWKGPVEEYLSGHSALMTEDYYHDQLEKNLETDRIIGQTRFGVHRSDVLTVHRQKNIPVSQCSTGEQKSLLLALVLAHAAWLQQIDPDKPLLLLLDDVAAHLDQTRQAQLFAWVENLHAQTWFTGTEKETFKNLDQAQSITLPIGIAL
jgi:DNA replication and repair protein RecF